MPLVLTQYIFPAVGAGAISYIAFLLYNRFLSFRTTTANQIMDMTGNKEGGPQRIVSFGSQEYKLRLAFSKFKINVAGFEKTAMYSSYFVAGAVIFVILIILGFSPTTSIIGFVGGYILINGLVAGTWSEVRTEVEKEIPSFLVGFTSTVQVTQDVLLAIEEETRTLRDNGPLQVWLKKTFLARCQAQGHLALEEVILDAFKISSPLGITMTMVGRMWTTGGREWDNAFLMASGNLEGVLEARSIGIAAGNSAKDSVKLIAAITGGIIVMMVRNSAMASAMSTPLVQISYGLIILLMLFGWTFMNDMIDSIF
jgi:hypothetical protein